MTKKIFNIVCAGIVALCPLLARAQWVQLPLDDTTHSRLIETKSGIVYDLTSAGLSMYNQNDNERRILNTSNGLTEAKISKIHYNHDARYLVVMYSSANIDLLYDDGSVVNLPDIRDAQLNVNPSINDIAFYNDDMLVACNFGLVVFDTKKMQVKETMFTSYPILLVESIRDHYALLYGQTGNYMLMLSPANQRHHSIDTFTPMYGISGNDLQTVADKYLVYTHSAGIYFSEPNFDYLNDPTLQPRLSLTGYTQFGNTKFLEDSHDGGFTGYTASRFFEFDAEGNLVTDIALPTDLKSNVIASYNGAKSVWAANAKGLGQYDLTDAANPVVLADRFKPEAITVIKALQMRKSHDGRRIYVSKYGQAVHTACNFPNGWAENYAHSEMRTNYIEDGEIYDVTVTENMRASTSDMQKENPKSYGLCGVFNGLDESPLNPNEFYIASVYEGVYRIDNRTKEITGHYNRAEGTAPNNGNYWPSYANYAMNVRFDPQGNLWLFSGSEPVKDSDGNITNPRRNVCVLPKEKLDCDFSQVTVDDWLTHPVVDLIGTNHVYSLLPALVTKSGFMIYNNHGYEYPTYIVNTKKTWTDFSDDDMIALRTFVDQDGRSWTPYRRLYYFEDSDGLIWMCTANGVFTIPQPEKITDPNFRVNRVKVPLNDGTGLADYLLNNTVVFAMDEDARGCKWFATEQGVFRTTADGSQILATYTAANSNLPENASYSIACDNFNNVVYLGTYHGVYSLKLDDNGDATDGKLKIAVAPNPVRPDYFGLVNITGLPLNGLVKIADNRGNVVYQGYATDGTLKWDACNASGARVKSGVYYVLTSSTKSDDSTAGTAKIVVIN